METLILLMAIALGYVIGVLQKGIHIHMDRKPLVPVNEEGEPQYNEDYSHNLPKEVQDYLLKNNGHIK